MASLSTNEAAESIAADELATDEVHLQHVNPADESSNENEPIDSCNNDSPFAKRTKPSTPLQATSYLVEISLRIDNAVSELKKITVALSSSDEAQDVVVSEAIIESLQKSITPFLALASKGIIDSAQLLSPIPGIKVLGRSQDAKWKRKVLEEGKEKDTRTLQRQFIDAYITSCYLNTEEFWQKKSEKRKSKAKPKADVPVPPEVEVELNNSTEPGQQQQHALQPDQEGNTIYHKVTALQKTQLRVAQDGKTIMLPLPNNGYEYTKIEVLSILTRLSGRQRSDVITEMIKKKAVPRCRTKLLELLKSYNQNIKQGNLNGGIYNEEWAANGRPRKGKEQSNPKDKPARKKYELKQQRPKPTPRPVPQPIVLPFPPKNGSMYSKSEFIPFCSLRFTNTVYV
eukprot:scaffold21566_cov73-Cyclotella_meneghiniana.AAC.23